MDQLFPNANIVAGSLILIVGVGFHWIGQSLSVINWNLATRIGLQEKGLVPEYRVYEHGIAVADAALGWVYALAAVGLFLGTTWGVELAWFPGTIMLYHGLSYWFWTGNQRRDGRKLMSDATRIGWTLANLVTGALSILVAWYR